MSILKAVEQAKSGLLHQNAYGDGLAEEEMVKIASSVNLSDP